MNNDRYRAEPALPVAPSRAEVVEACIRPMLIAQGWTPRFLADPMRRQEAETLYRELGFEVRAEPVRAEALPGPCRGCFADSSTPYVMLYTRRWSWSASSPSTESESTR